jgi:hypothetical protein
VLSAGVVPVETYTRVYDFDDAMLAMRDSIRALTPKAVMAVNA